MAFARAATTTTRSLGYIPWLDGMRAISVLAVMGDHENLLLRAKWLRWFAPSGFVGVDVFFVISGFLITSLLLSRMGGDRGRFFSDFYLRRARRLLPALAVLLTIVLVGGLLFEPHHRTHIVVAVLIVAAYSANWVRAFGTTTLASLGHTWTLACEEQFYALWPAMMVSAAAIGLRGRRLVAALGAASVLALVYPVVEAQRGWSGTRLYYGLDTHAGGLLLGAALGAAWTADLLPTGPAWTTVRRVVGVGCAVLLGFLIELGAAVDRRLYHLFPHLKILFGGDYVVTDCLLASLAAAGLLWALVSEPRGLVHRVLGAAPLRGLGRISYGVYLYSVPLFLLLTAKTTHIHSVPLLVVLHLTTPIAAAWVSYAVLERRFLQRPSKAPTGRATATVSERRVPALSGQR